MQGALGGGNYRGMVVACGVTRRWWVRAKQASKEGTDWLRGAVEEWDHSIASQPKRGQPRCCAAESPSESPSSSSHPPRPVHAMTGLPHLTTHVWHWVAYLLSSFLFIFIVICIPHLIIRLGYHIYTTREIHSWFESEEIICCTGLSVWRSLEYLQIKGDVSENSNNSIVAVVN